jgi:translation initiation factor IF-1
MKRFVESQSTPGEPPSAALPIVPVITVCSRLIMPVEEVIETEGKITSVLAGTMFRVELANKHLVLAHISGRMRKRFIRLTTGDRVKLEMSPYDLNKARIVYRLG